MESAGVVSKSVPSLIRVLSYNRDVLIEPSVLLWPFKALSSEFSWSNQDSYSCFFALDCSQAASGSHVANTVFAPTAPTVIQQGNSWRGKVEKGFCFRLKQNVTAVAKLSHGKE